MTKEALRQALAASVGRLMDEREWTQPELAKEADIAQSHVSRILSGEQSIGLDVIAAVADAFDVEPWELLMDEEATRRSVLERILRPKPAAEPRHVAHRKRKRKGNNGKSSD
jgi:transcriptional regulator with XRE-family HTH domain